jgi:hypothetical protein
MRVHLNSLLRVSLLTFALYSTTCTIAQAQVYQQWVVNYNGIAGGHDYAIDIGADVLGNLIVTGSSYDGEFFGGSGWLTIKYDPAGSLLWEARYNGIEDDGDSPNDMAVDADGNVYVTGFIMGDDYFLDYCTIKYDFNGVAQWVSHYNGSANSDDIAWALCVAADGDVYISGHSVDMVFGYSYCTIKYSSMGNQQWIALYHGPSITDSYARTIAIDEAENVYVTGTSGSHSNRMDITTVKYDSSGVQQWEARYHGPLGYGQDEGNFIAVSPAGNVYVCGESYGSTNTHDYVTIKYSSAGQEQWVQRYNGTGHYHDSPAGMALDADENVYVTGSSYSSPGNGNYNYVTIKYNTEGDVQWIADYNDSLNGSDYACDLVLDDSANVYVTGRSFIASNDWDFTTVKYNTDGQQQWLIRYDGPANGINYVTAMVLINPWEMGITGSTDMMPGTPYTYDYTTLRYVQEPLSTPEEIVSPPPKEFTLHSPHPNPFNSSTTIRFDLPQASRVTLEVFDVGGRKVGSAQGRPLHDVWMPAGSHEVTFDGSELPSGIYLYRLIAGQHTATGKLVLLK